VIDLRESETPFPGAIEGNCIYCCFEGRCFDFQWNREENDWPILRLRSFNLALLISAVGCFLNKAKTQRCKNRRILQPGSCNGKKVIVN
jgi:hypothetical protein